MSELPKLVRIKKYGPEITEGVMKLEQMGYQKISVLGSIVGTKMVPKCLKCGFGGFELNPLLLVPKDMLERAFVLFLCPYCEEEIGKLDDEKKVVVMAELKEKAVKVWKELHPGKKMEEFIDQKKLRKRLKK